MNDYDFRDTGFKLEALLMKAKYHNLDMTPAEADQYDIDRKWEQEMSIELDDYYERQDAE
jgi:hypothetical protein